MMNMLTYHKRRNSVFLSVTVYVLRFTFLSAKLPAYSESVALCFKYRRGGFIYF